MARRMLLPPLTEGVLLRRYKRFLADIRLPDGRQVVAHCPNPGRMTSCAEPGWRVLLSHHDSPKRKLRWSWELVDTGRTLVLVNTSRPNAVVREGIEAGRVPGLRGYAELRAEVGTGAGSRVDLWLGGGGRAPCWVEVKSVTLRTGEGTGAFPDAVSARATKHVGELAERVEAGERAALFFLVPRGDIDVVRPADDIDPVYGRALRDAVSRGVEVFAHRGVVTPEAVTLGDAVAVDLR